MEKSLRPYQQAIVDQVVDIPRDYVICLPTGAGKTVIANALMEALEGICIFIVPRLELIEQAKTEFGDVDVIWANKTELTGKKVIIASKDSLRNQMKKIDFGDNAKLTLIFDEAHVGIKQTHSLVESFKEIFPDARVLGLTATPERMDGYALLKGYDSVHKYGVFDEVLQKETVSSLIDKGYLTNLKYYAKPIDGITEIKPEQDTGEELSARQMIQIMTENNIWGDLVECYEKYGKNRPAIGFTVTIAMAEVIAEIFQKAGYDFRVIHGDMKVEERKTLITKLTYGEIDGLVNAALLTYGFDCPPVSYAFSVRHIKSRPLWFQMVGRILRLAENKEEAIFVDHGDSISEFSEPDNPLPILSPVMDWRADGENKEQKKERKKKMKKVQATMQLIQELAPLPSDMVEITVEDTYTRLINAIQKLQKENGSLRKLAQHFQQENARLEDEKMEALMIAEEAEEARRKAQKCIDSNKTFEYIKSNYCKIRRMLPDTMSDDEQHWKVMDIFEANEEKLDFYFDEYTFQRGMNYWKTHYQKAYTPKEVVDGNQG